MVDKNTVRRGYNEVAAAYAAERSTEDQGLDTLTAFF